MDNELLEKCLENDKKAKDRIYALLNEAIDIMEENRIPFFAVLEGENRFQVEHSRI